METKNKNGNKIVKIERKELTPKNPYFFISGQPCDPIRPET